MRFSDMENVRVAILGTGREGQAVWRQLRRRFPEKSLSLFAESEIDAGFLRMLDPAHDHCHVGPLNADDLEPFGILVRSAGISPYRPELMKLRSSGHRFTSASNLWFAENPDAKTICISGTKGKSTTAALIHHLLTAAGINSCLAGNIGRPMLDCEEPDVDWWVIELSSYQISDLEAAPDIVLLLNLSDEHVDWHGSAERYAADKLKLVELAGGGRVFANFADVALVARLAQNPSVTWFNMDGSWHAHEDCVVGKSGEHVSAVASLPGEHNMQNLAAALSVVDELGLEIKDMEEVLSTFSGLPHRLQLIGEKDGVRYVDDSISTTPVSVAAALQTIGNQGVVLLLGGMDRGLDWNDFAVHLIDLTPHAIITLPDNGHKIFDCLKQAGVKPEGGLHQSAQLEEAVRVAQRLVPEQGCILLSPGAPSFPHFKDFEDRGNQFKKYSGIENYISSTH
jgi:UDP-N-acetylmuramoylalanine--D-glutamate ligase